MSTGSISEEEVVEVSSDEEEQEEEMDKVMFNKEEMDKEDKKKDEDLRIEEVEEPMVKVVVTQRAKVRISKHLHSPTMVPSNKQTHRRLPGLLLTRRGRSHQVADYQLSRTTACTLTLKTCQASTCVFHLPVFKET